MVKRSSLIATSLLVVVAAVWWLIRAPADPSATPAVSPSTDVEPAANLARAAADVTSIAAPKTPLDLVAPGSGEAFGFELGGDLRVRGRLWRAAHASAPLLLLLPDDATRAVDWQQMVEVLREVRDYHLAAWDGLAQVGASVEGGGQLRHTVVAEGVLQHLRATPGLSPLAVGLIGVGNGATAALLLAAERVDLKATVAISPSPGLGPLLVAESASVLARRQLMVVASEGDGPGRDVLAGLGDLPHARLLKAVGHGRGLSLLRGDQRPARAINGWLYAAMGPVPR